MPIKVSQLDTRTIKAPFVYMDKGERKEEEIRVVYNTLTDELRGQLSGGESGERKTAREQVLMLVRELPDITDDETGQPIKVTDEFLRTKLSTDNLISILEAVIADASPKQRS